MGFLKNRQALLNIDHWMFRETNYQRVFRSILHGLYIFEDLCVDAMNKKRRIHNELEPQKICVLYQKTVECYFFLRVFLERFRSYF
jgi:hypothetical protein